MCLLLGGRTVCHWSALRDKACSSFGWWSRLHFETFFLPSSFRRPCFQRGEAWEKSQITAGPTFSPELWRKDCFEPASRVSANNLHLMKIVRCEGPVRKFAVQDEKKRGENHARKTTTPHEILLSLAADAGADTNKTHNNQPNKRFNKHLGRVSLQCWKDWLAVALLVSLLVSGPFSRTRTQVDCFELCFLIQISPDEAETFA